MYVPNDLEATPYIVLASRHPHSHPDPKPTQTLLTILGKFQNMVCDLGWHLADATPRRLALNSAFMASLRQELDWAHPHDPALSHLHPSLGNSNHVGRIIQDLRLELYPGGTGIKGAERFLAHQQTMPLPEQYLRCVESVSIPGHEPFIIIICMLPAMSQLLITTRRPSIDTSFKQADSYQEFEIEAWYPEQKKFLSGFLMSAIVCARAFTTSQSEPAHYHLFKRIFEIVEHDTGRPIHFRHIHGDGIETIVADAHKGQALGLGQLCASLSEKGPETCSYPCACPLHTLTPYDHLKHFFVLCVNHFRRGIHKLGDDISPQVRTAMHSLVSAYPIHNVEETTELIRRGGPRASAIMRGMHYDKRAMAAVDLMDRAGIHQRDQPHDYFRRVGRAVLRQEEKSTAYDTMGSLENANASDQSKHSSLRKLQVLRAQHEHLRAQAKELTQRGSGRVPMRDLSLGTVFEHQALAALPAVDTAVLKRRGTKTGAASMTPLLPSVRAVDESLTAAAIASDPDPRHHGPPTVPSVYRSVGSHSSHPAPRPVTSVYSSAALVGPPHLHPGPQASPSVYSSATLVGPPHSHLGPQAAPSIYSSAALAGPPSSHPGPSNEPSVYSVI
ncbi:hypothetical protein JB92DRAFT_3114722 [Gautieria morchelliformis]|nr:hypothetical protein JB92DRAFT_3114722 [Gautieria morchelliformis]